MSINFLNASLSGPKKAVLITLGDRASFAGFCYPSIDDIAYRAGCSKSTAISAISELESLGYLVIFRETGKPNKYVLSAEKLFTPRDIETPDNAIHSGVIEQKTGIRETVSQCQSDTQTINNHQEPLHVREAETQNQRFAPYKENEYDAEKSAALISPKGTNNIRHPAKNRAKMLSY